jgi:hypothetical protein
MHSLEAIGELERGSTGELGRMGRKAEKDMAVPERFLWREEQGGCDNIWVVTLNVDLLGR